jgi:hypothetical protein
MHSSSVLCPALLAAARMLARGFETSVGPPLPEHLN